MQNLLSGYLYLFIMIFFFIFNLHEGQISILINNKSHKNKKVIGACV